MGRPAKKKENSVQDLDALAAELGERLKARGETVAVAESSSGGLISAALLGVAGASKYYLGGAVVYTGKARMVLMDLPREAVAGMRSASEPYALLLARTARERFGATWGISETGAAGPTGNGYGDAAGHSCIAVSGPVEMAVTIETGESDRAANMTAFAAAALDLLKRATA
ncbi:MAG: putative competence-damaged inducible protein [Phenylobacterium sp.]|jgi:nicotinamide-nucleotide amidase|nr:putative competence-damaged inducible protein [Phenylobacterium sp.]MDB5436073.1 putative competence-damaged inducible protein [Phenylobacterium sp.]MDB5465033.1 putative competence-damaged inducible protein [Phenylobacterium sp.]MDB5499425.1 putative competence-damaged inducible protein [Phenylobacterium sp.]